MVQIKERFNQISPSEFFYSNRDLAGFSNPTRSLYTAVRELVENSLDACDQKGILPNVHLMIKAVDPSKPDPRHYILTVKDNGPGVDADHIPLAFGTVLYGSKFGLKQARGMFGLGATMAILYGQITTNTPVVVHSSVDGKTQDRFEILLDIQKNKPVIVRHETREVSKVGLTVSICLEGDYSKAGSKIRDYVYETSLITPYATIKFDDPKGQSFSHPRFVKEIPPPPTIIRPHPHGVDVERIRRMIVESQFDIPVVNSAMISKICKDIGVKKDADFAKIMSRTAKKWKGLTRHVRIVLAMMSFMKMGFDAISRVRIEDIDVANGLISYWDFATSDTKSVPMSSDSPYYRQLANTVQGEQLAAFLTKRFQRVGASTAAKFSEFAGFKPEKRVGTLTNQELVGLSDSLQKYDAFMAPDSSCLAPLGAEPLEKGIAKFFEPDFSAVVQRPASAYSGFPFVVEMGIAYGGQIPSGGPHVYRFANRIPLLYDEGSDVVLKVVNDIDWARYKVKGDPPFVIVSHICSTRVPYKTAGKENVADRPEIERELRLALQYLSRKLAGYMSKRGQAEAAKKRANLYAKYVPMIAQFCTELAGRRKEPAYQKVLRNTSFENTLGAEGASASPSSSSLLQQSKAGERGAGSDHDDNGVSGNGQVQTDDAVPAGAPDIKGSTSDISVGEMKSFDDTGGTLISAPGDRKKAAVRRTATSSKKARSSKRAAQQRQQRQQQSRKGKKALVAATVKVRRQGRQGRQQQKNAGLHAGGSRRSPS
ncbi:MAG: DNA topoisomerase VI subunit B [Thaumarchaeota archaeon]|nr:DNA topoisomerase VI subunit B [Nitrososphaerota archaeon]MDE0525135.1 DNA topoisomerase VI subunit B [Nitrososphaerota archaeon]